MTPNARMIERAFVHAPGTAITSFDGGISMVWPAAGAPALLDEVGLSMYECFAEPLSVTELADDLIAAVGLEPQDAMTSAYRFVSSIAPSGHLIQVGDVLDGEHWVYPPSASP